MKGVVKLLDIIRDTLIQNGGVLRLIPVFIPRRFSSPGRRLRLHPDDLYAYGTSRGAIKERWFSSVIAAMNGDDAAPDEGMSYVAVPDYANGKISLKQFVETLGAELLGSDIMSRYGTWPMYAKFFDYSEPLFHHLHLGFDDAARVGKIGKPEAYFYPVQYNNYPGNFPHTYFGFSPDVTQAEVRARLLDYDNRDIRITELSRAYRIELGTGWYTPPGVIHAPGSYLTYEPQWNSDVNSVFENITAGEVYPHSFLTENLPPEEQSDADAVMALLDWPKNVDPGYRKTYFRPPLVSAEDENHVEKWISYGNDYIAAKELTVYPGKTYIDTDDLPYGCIFVQGHGKFGTYNAETPTLLRFGQSSQDEYFVGAVAAATGVKIVNPSQTEPIVILKHFPACHPKMPTV